MKFKEFFFTKLFSLRNLFFLSNFIVLGLFLFLITKDYFREWKPYQKEYNRLDLQRVEKLIAQGGPETKEALQDELKRIKSRPLEIKQVIAADFARVDRCITCHSAYDSFMNPSLTSEFKDFPYAAPKNEVHEKHPPEKYGCTVCHEGQGLATSFVDAGHMPKSAEQGKEWKEKHQWEIVEYFEHPMNAGPMVYSSCSKCHQAHPNVPGMELIKNGKKLVFENGCVGCHQINGEGGTIAPDLALETAVKPLARIDFGPAVTQGLITKNERILENWIRLHFATSPAVITPGDPHGEMSSDRNNPQPVPPSPMPYFGFNKEETEALVAYVMSLKADTIPHKYHVSAPLEPEPQFANNIAHGRFIFQKYGCVSCHGKNADKGIPVYNKQGGHVPDLVKTLGTFTREELIKKIQTGVNPEEKEDPAGPAPAIYMPSFKDRIKGKDMDDLVSYLQSIAERIDTW